MVIDPSECYRKVLKRLLRRHDIKAVYPFNLSFEDLGSTNCNGEASRDIIEGQAHYRSKIFSSGGERLNPYRGLSKKKRFHRIRQEFGRGIAPKAEENGADGHVSRYHLILRLHYASKAPPNA